MNEKQKAKIKILTVFLALLAIGTILYLIFYSRRTNISQDNKLLFGTLESPINKNYFSKITVTKSDHLTSTNTTEKVYTIDSKNQFYPSKSFASLVASKLNMKLKYKDESFYLYERSNTSLRYTVKSKIFTIDFPTSQQEKDKYAISEDQAKILAKSKLEELGLWPFQNQYRVTFRYYYESDLKSYETTSKENISILSVVFTDVINGFPLIYSSINSGEIEVQIDQLNNIREIVYSYRPINRNSSGIYPIKNLDTAISDITTNNAELSLPADSPISTSAELNEVLFAYRILFDQQATIQPVYVFEGTDNNDNLVTFIVPAIEDQYLAEPATIE